MAGKTMIPFASPMIYFSDFDEAPAASIQFVGYASHTGSGTTAPGALSLTSLSDGIDTEPRENDIVIYLISYGEVTVSPSLPSAPSGYTSIYTAQSSDIYDTWARCCYKIQTATPDTSITPGNYGTSDKSWAGIALVFRGADTTTPLDAAATSTTGNGNGSFNCPANTVATAGAAVLACGTQTNTETRSVSGYTMYRSGAVAANSQHSGNRASIGVLLNQPPGAIDPPASTGGVGNSNDSWTGATVILKPA